MLHRHGGFPAIVVGKTIVLLATFAAAYWLCRRRGAGRAASVLALAAAALRRRGSGSSSGPTCSLSPGRSLCWRRSTRWSRAADAGQAASPPCCSPASCCGPTSTPGCSWRRSCLRSRPSASWRDGNGAARRLALAAVGAAVAVTATPVGFGIFRYLAPSPRPSGAAPDRRVSRAELGLRRAPVRLWRRRRWPWSRSWRVASARPARSWTRARRSLRPGPAHRPLRAVRGGSGPGLRATPRGRADGARRSPARPPAGDRRGSAPGRCSSSRCWAGSRSLPRLAALGPGRASASTRREVPLAAIAFVNDNGLRDRMYNDFEIGSYLLYDPVGGYPRHRVFVDPRLPAYPAELHRLLGRDDLSRDEWTAAMDRYGVETALLAYAGLNRRVAWWDPERWALVFREGDARVFVRRLPRYRALIAAREIPATFAFSVEEGTATLPLAGAARRRSPLPDCEWQRRVGDLLFELDGAGLARARSPPTRGRSPLRPAALPPRRRRASCAWLGRRRARGAAGRRGARAARSRARARQPRRDDVLEPRARARGARARGATRRRPGATVDGARRRSRRSRPGRASGAKRPRRRSRERRGLGDGPRRETVRVGAPGARRTRRSAIERSRAVRRSADQTAIWSMSGALPQVIGDAVAVGSSRGAEPAR